MAFLRIDGLNVSALVDDFDLKDSSVETYGRNVDDSLQGNTYSIKREITFETPPMTADDARAMEGWIRGRKHQWSFDRVDSATTRFTRYSSDGGLVMATTGTYSSTPLFGTYGLQLNATFTGTATAQFGSEGNWSVSLYHRPVTTGTFVSYVVRGGGTAVSQAFQNGAATGTLGFMSLTASSGFLRITLNGLTFAAGVAGTATTATYDQVAMYPYALTDAMVVSLASPTFGLPRTGGAPPPFVMVVGDALQAADVNATESGEAGPVTFKGFVDSFNVDPVTTSAGFTYNARSLRVRLVQR